MFLAKHGYAVTAMDGSRVGLEKAARFAAENGVSVSQGELDGVLLQYEQDVQGKAAMEEGKYCLKVHPKTCCRANQVIRPIS